MDHSQNHWFIKHQMVTWPYILGFYKQLNYLTNVSMTLRYEYHWVKFHEDLGKGLMHYLEEMGDPAPLHTCSDHSSNFASHKTHISHILPSQ